ncbi:MULTISPECIES: PadR family transcriptional regulator [unclassified Luteococcus]|uniref:PadR family transcriptional regulator n=1 Tax=unclassified Luteococcus TaxID=2639923 RepID=UPI00313C0D0D
MDEGWPTEWLRGVLELSVLRILSDGPTYGYAIATRLEEIGLGTVKGGTLYPLLARLEEAGRVETKWQVGSRGPGRKYFRLTPDGQTYLAQESARWSRFSRLTHDFICPTEGN